MREGKLKDLKAAGKDEITREMIKGGGDRVVDWICRVCNGKGERNECKNYRGISLLSVVEKSREGLCRSDLHTKADR